jgi:hypothetical protein
MVFYFVSAAAAGIGSGNLGAFAGFGLAGLEQNTGYREVMLIN